MIERAVAINLPPKSPATAADRPDSPAVISQSACASCNDCFVIANVAAADSGRRGCASPGAGSPDTGTTSGFVSGHDAGTDWSSIQERTAFTAHPDGSAVTVLCPTPGTTSEMPLREPRDDRLGVRPSACACRTRR